MGVERELELMNLGSTAPPLESPGLPQLEQSMTFGYDTQILLVLVLLT